MAAAVLTEPVADKAATMAPAGDLLYYSFPVTKTEELDDGTLKLWGRATDGSLDSDLQIVDPVWSEKALAEWYASGANVRVQHQAQRDPAGKGFEVRGHDIGVAVVEPVAVKLCKAGVLQDFSVGIMNPDIRRGDPSLKHLDPQGKAVNGIITGRPDGMSKIGEVSLVDRGSNFGTRFAVVKAAADGSPQYVGELTASDEVRAKVAEPAKSKTVTVDLPKNVSVSFSPKDLAKLVAHKQVAEQREAAKAAEPDVAKRDFDPNVGEHGTDRDTMSASDFAGRNRSFPIHDASDVPDALQSLGRAGADNYDKATIRRNILAIARRKGFPVPKADRKASKKVATVATKAAEPDTTKCMKCDGSGMMDGKPCPSCKKGKKAARKTATAEKRRVRKALAPAVVKKKKTMCPGCGAKQSVKHDCCTECGKPMPRPMPAVTKNHDFACLGCGHDPLDKGEKHCPSCGRENPGYLPEADHKIPANKAAKERVSKRKKAKAGKGKKDGNPFGGKQAPAFGAKDGDEDEPKGKKMPKPKVAKRKGKGKGRSPAAGVAGHDGDTMGLPAHREPDGAPVEEFEDDANMQDGDERQEMAAAMRHKSLATKGLSREDALLHDLCCPAFDPADMRKCFPYASFADIDGTAWQQKALMKAASGDPSALAMRDLSGHAETLKNAPPDLVHELRQQAHEAFLAANKMITDATPGPGSFPTPGHVMPQQFQRPYIDAGHAAESPQAAAPHHFGVPEGQPSAENYTRPFITEGRAADAPQNDTPRHEPIPAPMTPGNPSRMYYTNAMRDNARQAMVAMHDHISRVFPDVCPMSPDVSAIQKPAPEVPNGVGGPAPRMGKKAAKAAARKQRKALARKRRRLERKVLKGSMSVKQARRKLGLKAKARKGGGNLQAMKLAKASALPSVPVPSPLAVQPDLEALTKAVAEANAPLLERIAAQDKTLRKQRKAIDAIASQPDTSQAPLRGVALTKASAAPAVPQSATATAERVQMAELQRLHYVSRNSPDPGMREAARRDLETKLGLDSMTMQT